MIGTLLERLFVSVGVDLSEFGSSLDQASKEVDRSAANLKNKFEGIGQSFKNVGQGMARTGAVLSVGITAPFTALLASAIPAAEESAKAIGQVNARLASMGPVAGKTSGDLVKLAGELQKVSTFDDDDILTNVTANLLTFGNVSGSVFDRAQKAIVDLSAGFGQDLKSSAVQVGKALQDPINGMGALTRVGVTFTEQQKKQIEAMQEAGNIAGAQGVLLQALEGQFAGSAKAMRDATPGAEATDAWRNFQETIGAFALEILPPLTAALTSLLNGFNELSPGVQKTILVVAGVAAALGPLLIGLGSVVTAIGILTPVLAPVIAGIAGIAAAITAAAIPAMAAIAVAIAPLLPILAALAGAAALVYAAYQNWGAITAIAQNLYNGVKTYLQDKLGAVFSWLQGKLIAVGKWFFELYDAVVGHSYIPDMVDEIGQNMARLQGLMVDPAKKATDKTKAAFAALASNVSGVLDSLFPLQAQLRAVLEDMATLESAKAAGQISAGTYDAARGALADKAGAIREQMRPPGGDLATSDPARVDGEISTLLEKLAQIPPAAMNASESLRLFGEQLGDDVVRGLGAVLTGRATLKDVLKDMFSNFLESTINSALKSLETSIFGKGGLGGFLGGLFSSVISGRAVGGPVVPGRAYTVGAGELFQPSQSGRVLSRNDAMRAAGGGDNGRPGRISVTVNGARGNQEIMAMVREGVQQGIGQYDRVVGGRVNNDFKRRS